MANITGIWVIVAIPAGLVLLVLFSRIFWMTVDAIRPFMYCRVPLAEIHDHVCALFRRGLNRSQMLITCEQSGKQIRCRKTYEVRGPGMAFHLLVPALVPAAPGLTQALTDIEALGLKQKVVPQSRYLITLDVDCLGAVDKALAAADVVLSRADSIMKCPTE